MNTNYWKFEDRRFNKPIGYNPTNCYRNKVAEFINKVANEGSIEDNLKYKPCLDGIYLRLLVIYEGIIITLYQRSLSTREKLTFDG